MEKRTAYIWPRLEPFLVGVLPAAPPAKLSAYYLRKMAAYVRSRHSCFPRLGWHMWRHIACGKLQLAEEVAWLYFEAFDQLIPISSEARLERAEALSQCQSPREMERQRGKLSVDTLQFLLFLYLQQVNRSSLRTSLIGEEWPSARSPSPLSERDSRLSCQHKNWDEQAHLAFIQTRISDLLELLQEPDGGLALAALKSLSLLLEGSTTTEPHAVLPVHKLLARAPLHAQAGFSKPTRTYSLLPLQAFLLRSLCINPFGISCSALSDKSEPWATHVEGSMKKARILRNTQRAPAGERLVLVSQLCRQTLAKDSEKLKDANVKLQRCSDAFIYLLTPLRSVTLEKCRNVTVVLGPVKSSVHLQSCERVRLVCAAGRVSVGGSARCTLHLLTPTRPLLLPGNSALTLAPFHTHYPALEEHMASAGLAVVPDLWAWPLPLEEAAPGPSCWRVLPPCEFYPLVIPFRREGESSEMPWSLPQDYSHALSERERRVEDWQRSVTDADLTKAQSRRLQTLVEQKFHEWLLEAGHRLELDTLLPAPTDHSPAPKDPPHTPLKPRHHHTNGCL